MSTKSKQCAVTTIVSDNEKRLFVTMAGELGTPYNVIMRRLIRYFLDGKVSWSELFRQYKELSPARLSDQTEKRRMRVHLTPEQYVALTQLTEEWGSTTATVLRRLMLLYIAGKIKRSDIW